MRRIISLIALTLGLMATMAIASYFYLADWMESPVILQQPKIVDYPKGTPLGQLAKDLEQQGVISNRWLFLASIRLFYRLDTFQAGSYRFSGDIRPSQVLSAIRQGKVFLPIVFKITVPEGFNLKAIAQRAIERGLTGGDEILRQAFDPTFASLMGIEGPTLEGYTFPATYEFTKMPNPKEFWQTMVEKFFQTLPSNFKQRLVSQGLSLHEAVIMASLIEVETPNPDERPMIAEVIQKRLKKGIPLGIDAALIYGIKDYDGDIKWKHLKDKKNPYNGRIFKGLPPTPIAAPSLPSLEAVLEPTQHGYLYYVRQSGDVPRHIFSRTLKEHQRHVDSFVRSEKATDQGKR